MKIIKKSNGNVWLTDDAGQFITSITTNDVKIWPSEQQDIVHIVVQNDRYENIEIDSLLQQTRN